MRCLLILTSLATAVAFVVPSLPLYNTAEPGMTIPYTGLGTGAYSQDPASTGAECWAGVATVGAKDLGCSAAVTAAVTAYIKQCQAARVVARIDSANSYLNAVTVGEAIAASGAKREDIFLLTKLGPSHPLGGPDMLEQFDQALLDLGVEYVDSCLIHWPFDSASQGNVTNNSTASKDPACQPFSPATYNMTTCRLNSWRSMLTIFASGKARSVGVSNYNSTYFDEILAAGLPMPALSQNPYHLYRSSSQDGNRAYMRDHNITFLAYSPLGVPDWAHFPTSTGMSSTMLRDPVLLQVAAEVSLSPAQTVLQWMYQLGIPTNPRTFNTEHMAENLQIYSLGVNISASQMVRLSSRPQAWCEIDPTYYDCD